MTKLMISPATPGASQQISFFAEVTSTEQQIIDQHDFDTKTPKLLQPADSLSRYCILIFKQITAKNRVEFAMATGL